MLMRSASWILAVAMASAAASALSARAQPPPASESALTARSAAEAALRANPELQAAYQAIEAARSQLLQAGLWPNPELGLAGRSDFAFQAEGERSFGVELAQRLPIGGRLARARDLALVDVAVAFAEARDFERRLIGEVQRAVFGLLALDQALETRASVIRTARELARVAARRLRAAEVSEADVNLLEIELARFEQERRLLELEHRNQGIRLNQLLNRPAAAPVVVEGHLDAPAITAELTSDPVAEALARRPDLEAMRLDRDRARAEARLAKAESWEDWTLGGGFERDRQVFRDEPASDPIGVKRDDFLGLRLSVPLPIWNRNQGRVAAADAQERRARARLAALERAAEAEMEAAAQRVAELERVAREYHASLLPLAERNAALLDRAYRQGLVSMTTLVQAEQQLADTTLRHARTQGELRQAEIELETATAASPLLAGAPRDAGANP